MKKTLILVLVLGFFFVTLLQGEEKIATSGGRWQLLQVAYQQNNFNDNTKYKVDTVLKIDTETGRTYRLLSQIPDMVRGEQEVFKEIPAYDFKPEEKK